MRGTTTGRNWTTCARRSEPGAAFSSAATRCAARRVPWTRCCARRPKRRVSSIRGFSVKRTSQPPNDGEEDFARKTGPSRPGLTLLAGVQQVLRVEGPLDPVVQVVARWAELVLELAALQPADAVLAADRAAEAQRELEQLVARVVGALLFVEIVGREEERGVDVAVARMPKRQRGDIVPLADRERLARNVAELVERHRDVLAIGAAALREDRECRTAA